MEAKWEIMNESVNQLKIEKNKNQEETSKKEIRNGYPYREKEREPVVKEKRGKNRWISEFKKGDGKEIEKQKLKLKKKKRTKTRNNNKD